MTPRKSGAAPALTEATPVEQPSTDSSFVRRAPRVTISDAAAWALFTALVVAIIWAFCALTWVIA